MRTYLLLAAAAAAAAEEALAGLCRDARLVGPGERGGRAINAREQCSIAKSDECGNHYARTYFCATSSFSRFCFAALCVAWLGMLFVLLGSTADDYFSPALEQLSEDAGLPPRFAGVTLLALGNGAPDVSSNVHLVASDALGERAGLDTALGALTGAGMFVTTCVAGMVILIAGGAKARGALLRDIAAYGVACAVVWGFLAHGRVDRTGAALLLVLYGVFVAIVLAADLYHRRPAGPYDLARRNGADAPDDAVEMMLTLIHDVRQRRRRPQVGSSADEEKASTPTARNPFWDETEESTPARSVVIDGDDVAPLRSALLETPPPPVSEEVLEGFFALDIIARARASVISALADPLPRKVLTVLELPFNAARACTVPLTSKDRYARAPFALSLLGAPVWLCCYAHLRGASNIFVGGFIPLFYVGAVVGAGCAAAAWHGTREIPELPFWAATAFALVGFLVAATWIDVFAGELASSLEFFAALSGTKPEILGLTLLAWGNSVGDYFTNVAMARKGLANMALTACFAGPVFNLLVTLGIGFLVRLNTFQSKSVAVASNDGIGVGLGMIIANCACVAGAGLVLGGRLPKQFGFFGVSLYALYLVVALALLFAAAPEGDD